VCTKPKTRYRQQQKKMPLVAAAGGREESPSNARGDDVVFFQIVPLFVEGESIAARMDLMGTMPRRSAGACFLPAAPARQRARRKIVPKLNPKFRAPTLVAWLGSNRLAGPWARKKEEAASRGGRHAVERFFPGWAKRRTAVQRVSGDVIKYLGG